MPKISNSELRRTISDIMRGADLSTLSSKKIRILCEKKFGVDLTSRRKEVDEIVMSFVENEESGDENNSEKSMNETPDSSDSDESSQSGSSSGADSESSSDRATSLKDDDKRVQSPKKVLAKGKSNASTKSTQSKSKKKQEMPNNSTEKESLSGKSSVLDDAAVARKLQAEEWNFRRRAVKRVPREVSKKKDDKNGQPKKKKASTYTRKCMLSPQLAEVMQTTQMARPDVVKKMWGIVKERNLFDPSNKRYAICDEQLLKVFGKERILMFGMMKYLKNHIKDIN
ncbi:Upstream activation factor subunit spp27, partial [Stegodyphus mimosarum]